LATRATWPGSLTRRDWLAACAMGSLPLMVDPRSTRADEPAKPSKLGVVIHSYAHRTAADRRGEGTRFDDPIRFLEYCHGLGAGCVQVGLGVRNGPEAGLIKEKAEALGMDLEGIVFFPRNRTQVDRFRSELSTASECGAKVVRAVMLGGRRYETFASADAFQQFAENAIQSLNLVAKVMEPITRHVCLAIENHKDFRSEELVAMLKKLDTDKIGVCVDTGNNIALLEDPMETVEMLAPWAFSTHLKDMAVQEYEDGFLLSEVPFGEGFLDLPRMVRVLQSARPDIRFNIEMITRDPLKIPCLTDKYWATFENLSGRHLASTLRMVRAQASKTSLPKVSGLKPAERIKIEDENVRRCLAYGRERLGL
jgi:sugar phosphate isomerase/epimerase